MNYALAGAGALVVLGLLALEWRRRLAGLRKMRERLQGAPSPPAQGEGVALLDLSGMGGPLILRRIIRQTRLPLKPWDIALVVVAFGAAAAYAGWTLKLPPPWVAGLTGIFAWFPFFVLQWYGEARVRKLEVQLADAIDLMQGALQSGVGVRQSLELVRAEKRPPIRDEINELISLIELGLPAPRAFQQWAAPIGSKIIDAFALSMSAKWDVGGSYKEMMAGMATRIRDLLRLQRRVRSMTAEARLTAFLVTLMPYGLALFQTYFNPTHLAPLWDHPARNSLLGGAVGMQFICFLWMRRMIRGVM